MQLLKARLHGLRRYKDLWEQLVIRDLKLKYRRSFLGYVWSVLNPLLIMIVMTIVFSTMFKRDIENFPVYLLTGRAMFDFLTISTNKSMNSIIGNAALIKKTYVPKYIFTLATVTSALVDFIFSLGALVLVMLVTRAKFTIYFLLFPFVAFQLYIFCLGLGLFLAQANVFFRDIQYIYSVITTAWLYLTPIFYPVDMLSPKMQIIVKGLNPLYYYIGQFRDLVYYGRIPGYRVLFGGWIIAFVMLALSLIHICIDEIFMTVYIQVALIGTFVHTGRDHPDQPYDPQNVVCVLVGDEDVVNARSIDIHILQNF